MTADEWTDETVRTLREDLRRVRAELAKERARFGHPRTLVDTAAVRRYAPILDAIVVAVCKHYGVAIVELWCGQCNGRISAARRALIHQVRARFRYRRIMRRRLSSADANEFGWWWATTAEIAEAEEPGWQPLSSDAVRRLVGIQAATIRQIDRSERRGQGRRRVVDMEQAR